MFSFILLETQGGPIWIGDAEGVKMHDSVEKVKTETENAQS